MKEIHKINNINKNEYKNSKRKIMSNIINRQEKMGELSNEQLKCDIRNNPLLIKRAIVHTLPKMHNLKINIENINFNSYESEADEFTFETNLSKITSLNNNEIHKVIERALLSIGGLNIRIEEMNRFNAISGLKDDDLPLLDEKINFLNKYFNPEVQKKRLHRLFNIIDFPDLNFECNSDSINLTKLIKIRNSDECKEFRNWLPEIDKMSDVEIKELVNSMQAKISSIIHTKLGKSFRFLI